MNIWLINHYANLPSQGFSTRHYSLAKYLMNLGHDVTVVASSRLHNSDQSKSKTKLGLIEKIIEEKVKFFLISTPPYTTNVGRIWNMISFSYLLLKNFQEIGDMKPDIIIGSSVHPFAAWAAERIANRYKVPFVFEIRDLWPKTLVDMGLIGKFHPLTLILSWLEKYLCSRAEKIICLLPYAYEYLETLGLPQSKFAYLPNGVDIQVFDSNSTETKEKHDDVITVMYLGSHGFANDLRVLVDAAKYTEKCELPKILWKFVGDGPEKKSLKAQALDLNLSRVSFLDAVPKTEVPDLIQEADILIVKLLNLDVYRYGISLNKLFDYLASRKPIVFIGSSRNNPVMEANAGISLSSDNPREIAEAVCSLATLPLDERRKFGIRGRQYTETYHDYKVLAQRLDAILRESIHMFREKN